MVVPSRWGASRTQALTLAAAAAILPVTFGPIGCAVRGAWAIAIFVIFGTSSPGSTYRPGSSSMRCYLGQLESCGRIRCSASCWQCGTNILGPACSSGLLAPRFSFGAVGPVTIHFTTTPAIDGPATGRATNRPNTWQSCRARAYRTRPARSVGAHAFRDRAEIRVGSSSLGPTRARGAGDSRRGAHFARCAAQVRSAVRGYPLSGPPNELQQRGGARSCGCSVETAVHPAPLSPTQESVFALALREAVTNVVRHAHATVCRLAYDKTDPIAIEIADNGRGDLSSKGAASAVCANASKPSAAFSNGTVRTNPAAYSSPV